MDCVFLGFQKAFNAVPNRLVKNLDFFFFFLQSLRGDSFSGSNIFVVEGNRRHTSEEPFLNRLWSPVACRRLSIRAVAIPDLGKRPVRRTGFIPEYVCG